MRIWLVEDTIDYSATLNPVLFTTETLAREYFTNADLFTDGRALLVADTDTCETATRIEYRER